MPHLDEISRADVAEFEDVRLIKMMDGKWLLGLRAEFIEVPAEGMDAFLETGRNFLRLHKTLNEACDAVDRV